MPLESPFAELEDLTVTNPVGTDTRDKGDDHIRGIKVVLATLLKKLGMAKTMPTLTIATGSVTPTRSVHLIDTEAAAAADDLDTIVITGYAIGSLLLVRQVNAARDVTFKHGTGNLSLIGAADVTLGDQTQWLMFVATDTDASGTADTWAQVALDRRYTASRAMVTDASGNAGVSTVTATELGYVSGVTSAIQTQLASKADAGAIAGLSLTGGDTLELQTSANSVVIFPTTGTLATLAGSETLTNKTIDAGIFTGVGTGTGSFAPAGGVDPGANGQLWKVKIVEIGDWNMDTTASVSVAHGLTASKIRHVSAIIRTDADNAYYPVSGVSGLSGDPAVPLYINNIDATNVDLNRVTAGRFDSNTEFDSTSYNRGWITILYVP